MAELTENINIGWYGKCGSCVDFDLYDQTTANLVSGVENVESITQIKDGGFVYTTWLMEKDVEKRNEWETLPQIIKTNMEKLEWVKDCQGITHLECGRPYLIKIIEGTSIMIDDFHLAGLGHGDAGRVVECEECPTFPDCICED